MDFAFKDSYLLGVARLDDAHRQLFAVANRCLSVNDPLRDYDVLLRAHEELFNHAERHMVDEEHFMTEIGYPELTQHRQIHNRLMADLDCITESYDNMRSALTIIQTFCVRFAEHVLFTDSKVVAFQKRLKA